MSKVFLTEVIIIRILLIILLVFYHAFAIFSGAWEPLKDYPSVPIYAALDKLSYVGLLETFVFISGYILGHQITLRGGESYFSSNKFYKKKFNRLLVPSVIFSVLYLLIFNTKDLFSWSSLYTIINGAGHMWFLPMLFWCFVWIAIIEKLKISIHFKLILVFFISILSMRDIPLRIGYTMYYFLFFYIGYIFSKYRFTKKINPKVVLIVIIILVVLLLWIKTDSLLLTIEFLKEPSDNLYRIICAFIWISILFPISLFANKMPSKILNYLVPLSDCCFGVYIFQQFILKVIYNCDTITQNINPYILPWCSFLITLLLSLLFTKVLRGTKIGKKLL